MNKTIKGVALLLLLLSASLVLLSCTEEDPYGGYDREGFTVSVRYDANGGMFTTNVETIVDSYNYDALPTSASGKKELALLAPDDPRRGTGNAFKASNAGYFLAGWYTECKPVLNADGEALDVDGNLASGSGKQPAYSYAGRWDFEKTMELDPEKEYTSSAPITLYAAWIPEFKFEFYDIATGTLLDSYLFDPNYISSIALPMWEEETGELDMKNFPTVSEKTLDGVYLDAAKTQKAEGECVLHAGKYNKENATAEDPVMKLYLDYLDGERFHIYTAKQFVEHASAKGYYEIYADLDFTGLIWPSSYLHGNFGGTIVGNGFAFKNIAVEQTNAKRQNTGLFGNIVSGATFKNVTFENVTMTVTGGTIQQDAAFGLFAGSVDASVVFEDFTVKNSKLQINVGASILDNTSIGLFCGSGRTEGIDLSGITAELIGESDEKRELTVDGNEVTVIVRQ